MYADEHSLALMLDIDLLRSSIGRWREGPRSAGLLARAIALAAAVIDSKKGAAMCACVSAGKKKCAWCKEAEAHGLPKSRHNCQWGSCS